MNFAKYGAAIGISDWQLSNEKKINKKLYVHSLGVNFLAAQTKQVYFATPKCLEIFANNIKQMT